MDGEEADLRKKQVNKHKIDAFIKYNCVFFVVICDIITNYRN